MTSPAPQIVQLLQRIKAHFSAVTYHPEDPHRTAIEAAAAEVGLVCVPDPGVQFRRIAGCPAPPEPFAMPAPRALPEPPPGFLVRSEWGDVIWHAGDGEWVGTAPNGTHPTASWQELAGGKFGPVEALVPVPLAAAAGDDEEFLAAALDHLLHPIIEAIEQLAGSAVSGVRALLGEALRRGERRGSDVYTFSVPVQGLKSPDGIDLLREIIAHEQRRRRGDT